MWYLLQTGCNICYRLLEPLPSKLVALCRGLCRGRKGGAAGEQWSHTRSEWIRHREEAITGSFCHGIIHCAVTLPRMRKAERPQTHPKRAHFPGFLLWKVAVRAATGACPSQDGFMLWEKRTQQCSFRRQEQDDEAAPHCLSGSINWK